MFHIVATLETTHKHLGTGSVLQLELLPACVFPGNKITNKIGKLVWMT